MTYTPVYTRQFEKDFKRIKRRGKNLDKFNILARTLLSGEPPDAIHRDHQLVGGYTGRRECHIESDWLLIYKVEKTRIIFERMGNSGDAYRNSSLPVPEPVCVATATGRRQTGTSSLKWGPRPSKSQE